MSICIIVYCLYSPITMKAHESRDFVQHNVQELQGFSSKARDDLTNKSIIPLFEDQFFLPKKLSAYF